MTRDADFKAVVRARARQRSTSYSQARRETLARPRQTKGVLHVTNGDSAAGTIGQIGLPGPVLAWRDVLHEGPVPGGLSADELRHARARFLAAAEPARIDQTRSWLIERDALLTAGHETYVLWFEADLYDQLQLIQVLDSLAAQNTPPERISLVSAGEYPGVAHFGGLGELTADALAGLYEQRVTLGPPSLELAQRAWRAFTASDPVWLPGLATERTPELRFLGEAIGRLMQEYPWRGDGLSLSQRRILAGLAEGQTTAGRLFGWIAARERRPYLGDAIFYDYLRDLATAAQPLVELAGDPDAPARQSIALTEVGRHVLDGRVDHLQLNEIDRWIGGVHLTGPGQWRYDERRETIVPTA